MPIAEVNDLTLVELLEARSQDNPHGIAYTFLKDGESDQPTSLTYRDLERQARSVAAQLHLAGVGVGDRVLLVYPYDAGLAFIAAFWGCLYGGIVAVPCHPPMQRNAHRDIAARLKVAEAKAILSTAALVGKLKQQLSAGVDVEAVGWIATDQLSLDASGWVKPPIEGDRLAFLQFTSGSTGVPKGVMVTHDCLRHNQQMIQQAFGNSQSTICASWLPLYHDMGLVGKVVQPLYLGGPCILMSPIAFVQQPMRWLQAISRYRATTSGAPNFAYDLVCRHVKPEHIELLDLSCWELAFCGAEPIRVETIERFCDAFAACGFRREAFYPCYGMAEATLLISGSTPQQPPVILTVDEAALEQNRVAIAPHQGRAIVGCGQAVLNETIAIVDPQTLKPCPPDRVGEIWVASPGVGKGYWNLPEETERTFRAHLNDVVGSGPFLRTGDLGFLREGELFITGRLKELMVFWGFNHYPQHIEQTVQMSHPALKSNGGAAFAVSVAGEERLVIAQEVERSHRRTLVVDEVVEAIRWAVFQDHFVDVYAIALLSPSSLPKTSSGKIQRAACRARFLAGELEVLAEWRSPQPEDSTMTALVQRYLNPLTHGRRYWAMLRGSLRRLRYRLPAPRGGDR